MLNSTNALFEGCFNYSMEFSHALGKPTRNLYEPEWKPCLNCTWKEIYNPLCLVPDKDTLARVMCANRTNSMKSLCSPEGQKTKDGSRETLNKNRNKWYASLPE